MGMNEFSSNIINEVITEPGGHEVFLAFINDAGAEAFHDWWGRYGCELFETWALENYEGY